MHDALDEALERLRGTGTEVAGGIAPNHGPMGAEALVALGRDDAVVAWADRYRRNLALMPASNAPITKETWREGLGVIERIGDWVVFFRTQLAEDPWRSVFTEWIGRFAAGDAFSRRPWPHPHRARSPRVAARRDAVAHRGVRCCPSILGSVLPKAPGGPTPSRLPRLRPSSRPSPALPARPVEAGGPARGLPPSDGGALGRILGCGGPCG